MVGEHDRQESGEQMQLATRAVLMTRQRFLQLPEQLDTPMTGSMLHVEREHTKRGSTDTLVMGHRARAYENLERIFEMMIDEEGERLLAYPFSLYSLTRAAVEAAAVAMWLVMSSKKADRVHRALQITFRDANEALRLAELVMGKGKAHSAREATKKSIERLNELKNTIGPLRQVELGNPPSYTAILRAISPKERGALGYSIASPLIVWKAASAFLHGSDQLVRAFSDIRQLSDFDDGVASFEITPNIQMISVSLLAVVELIEELDERYVFLSTHNHAKRPVGAGEAMQPRSMTTFSSATSPAY